MAKTIAVTGKGGVGKTTIAALIIRYLKQHAAGPVLAIDADPDSNLGTVLGVDVPETLGDVRELTLAEIRKLPPGMDKAAYIEAGLHETIVETEGVDFLAMGRPEGPGCYCYVNNLLRGIMDKVMRNYEFVVIDSAAGLEHMSRRVIRDIDALIVVTDASRRGIRTAERIRELASSLSLNVRRLYLVLNKVRDESRAELERVASELSLDILGCVPFDEHIAMLDLLGKPMENMEDGSVAFRQVREMAEKLNLTGKRSTTA